MYLLTYRPSKIWLRNRKQTYNFFGPCCQPDTWSLAYCNNMQLWIYLGTNRVNWSSMFCLFCWKYRRLKKSLQHNHIYHVYLNARAGFNHFFCKCRTSRAMCAGILNRHIYHSGLNVEVPKTFTHWCPKASVNIFVWCQYHAQQLWKGISM